MLNISPCPFCGNEIKPPKEMHFGLFSGMRCFKPLIKCEECNVSMVGESYTEKEENHHSWNEVPEEFANKLIEKWNTRYKSNTKEWSNMLKE